MKTIILLDHDLEGRAKYLRAGLREIGWDQLLTIEFVRLRDFGVPEDFPDSEIWRFAQQHGFLLITNNRNSEDETSLSATIERENTTDSVPIITVSRVKLLRTAEYRQRAAYKLVEIIIYPEKYLGTGRLYIP